MQEVSIFSKMAQLSQAYNAVNLGQGYPNFDCDDRLKSLVIKYLNEGKNQYAPMAGVPELRTSIAQKLLKSYDIDVDPHTEITITSGATQAIFTIINAMVRKGDEVIVMEPAYDSYVPSIKAAGGMPKVYEMEAPHFKIDWNVIKKLISAQTKMIIINSPHNPTGSVLTKDDLKELELLIAERDIFILSDEVYEHLIYDGVVHQSVLKYPEIRAKAFAVFSFGKTFHNTGWKMGYAVAPEMLSQKLRNLHQWNVFSVNSFIQYALAEYLKMSNTYDGLSTFYEKKRDYLLDTLDDLPFKKTKSQGTYFQLYDFSDYSQENDLDFSEWLVKEHGVATIPISPFYSSDRTCQHVRFCFAKTEVVIDQAASRLSHL